MRVLGAYPFGTPPVADEPARIAGRAGLAIVRDAPGAPPLVTAAVSLARLGDALAVKASGAPFHWEGPQPVHVELWGEGGAPESLFVALDGSVRLAAWGACAEPCAPRPLFEWLAEMGAPGPLRAFERSVSSEAPAARAAFHAAAPAWARPLLETLPPEPPWVIDLPAVRQLVAAAFAPALFDACAWYGARPGAFEPPFPFETAALACLVAAGVHEGIAAMASGVPEAARRGAARFLLEQAGTRAFELERRLPLDVRAELAAAAAQGTSEAEAAHGRALFLGEGSLAPPGTELVLAAASGRLRRLCTDGTRAFAIDGSSLLRIEAGRAAVPLAVIFKPDSPLLAEGSSLRFLHPSGPRRVAATGGDVSAQRAPLFGWTEIRLARARGRLVRRALAALSSGMKAPLLLDLADDAASAYASLGGDMPAALALDGLWAASPAERALRWIPDRGRPVVLALEGRPAAISVVDGGALVAVERVEGGVSLQLARSAGGLETLATVAIPAGAFRKAILVAGRPWVLFRAPLGDVLVRA